MENDRVGRILFAGLLFKIYSCTLDPYQKEFNPLGLLRSWAAYISAEATRSYSELLEPESDDGSDDVICNSTKTSLFTAETGCAKGVDTTLRMEFLSFLVATESWLRTNQIADFLTAISPLGSQIVRLTAVHTVDVEFRSVFERFLNTLSGVTTREQALTAIAEAQGLCRNA